MNIKNLIVVAGLSLWACCNASAQFLLVGSINDGTVGKYNAQTGQAIDATFITGLSGTYGIAHDSSSIYVASVFGGTVGKYDLNTGNAIASSFISGLTNPSGVLVHEGVLYIASTSGGVASYNAETGEVIDASLIAVGGTRMMGISNGTLYVGDHVNAVVGRYELDGTPISASFVTGINPGGITFSGTSMFVTAAGGANEVREYNALTGALLGTPISSGLSDPIGLISDGQGRLFVANLTGDAGSVGRFQTNGTPVNNPFIVGVSGVSSGPVGLDYVAVPEPSTVALIAVAGVCVVFGARRRLRKSSTR